MSRYRLLALLMFSWVLLPQLSSAEEFPLCTGYLPEYGVWLPLRPIPDRPEVHCPAGMAILSLSPATGFSQRDGRADKVPPQGTCCPLPEASLTNEVRYQAERCPPDHVITGSRIAPGQPLEGLTAASIVPFELRCTRINTEEFSLSAEAQTLELKESPSFYSFYSRLFGAIEVPRTSRGKLPPNLRYGLGREGRALWGSACIGYPWGAVATAVGDHVCRNYGFAILRRKKPSPGQPSCRYVEDPYSPNARCLRW